MTLVDHLSELRTRVIRSLIVLAVAAIGALFFAKDIYQLLQEPMARSLPEGSFFIATGAFEAYTAYFKVALLFGFFVASPFIFYQFWQFIAPALHKNEKKLMLPFAFSSGILFVGGALFGYFVVFPAGFYYVNLLLSDTTVKMMPQMDEYLNVAITLLLAFGFTFELPLVVFLLGKLGLIDYSHIRQYRRYVIVFLFIAAAVLTPGPDILSQCLLALPLWALFELGGLSLLLLKKRAADIA